MQLLTRFPCNCDNIKLATGLIGLGVKSNSVIAYKIVKQIMYN